MRSITLSITSITSILMMSAMVGLPFSDLTLAEESLSQTNPSRIAEPEKGTSGDVQTEPSPPAEAGEVQERGFLQNQLQQGIFKTPQATTPLPPTKIPVPGITAPAPGTVLPPDRYQAPTPNLTMVANALRLKHKSLTTLVTIAPSLPVTQPVTINIGYFSPAGTYRATQSYVRGTGNRFLYNDKEGDGKPRRITIAIELTEPKQGGGIVQFKLDWQADLDPLYDVKIGQLGLKLVDDCDSVGESEILVGFFRPDKTFDSKSFSLYAGGTRIISKFEWARTEVSASANFVRPTAMVIERDVDPFGRIAGTPETFLQPDLEPLLPAQTGVVKFVKRAQGHDCRVEFIYQGQYTLRFYPYL